MERRRGVKLKVAERQAVGLQVSVNSFVLGFLIGCTVFYALGWTGVWSACISCSDSDPSAVVLVRDRSIFASSSYHHTNDSAVPSAGIVPASRSPPIPLGCPSRPLHLAVLVLSAPKGLIRRNAIRGTWLYDFKVSEVSVSAKFLVGTHQLSSHLLNNLTQEESTFNDVLLLKGLKDSYNNLSAKVLLGLQWAYRNVPFDFLLKTDDDSYVRIKKLVAMLRKMDCDQRLYWGYFMGLAFPEPSGKWAERNWFMCPHYLPYAMGGGYVLSRKVVGMLMHAPQRLKLYSNEDVTTASWLAPFHLHRKHDLRFDVESLSRGCNNNFIITHKERIRTFYQKYTGLLKNGTMCQQEKEIQPGYVYNWTASPLDCCKRIRGLPVLDDP